MKKLFLFTTLGWLFIARLSAAYTLPELIDQAFTNNPATKAAWWNAQRAAAAVGEAKSADYPTVTAAATLGHGRTYKYPRSDEITYTQGGEEPLFSYLLFDCGERRATLQVAQAALNGRLAEKLEAARSHVPSVGCGLRFIQCPSRVALTIDC